MTEMAFISGCVFWLLSQAIALTRPGSHWAWYLKADAALSFFAVLVLK